MPDTISLTQEEINQCFPLWLLWRATEKKFLPSQLLREPSEPLAVLLELDGYFDRIVEQIREDERKEQPE